MKKYLGVKLLGAEPMTRGEFAKHKYHKEVNEGLPEDPGYLVEYEGGYQSWSPKDVFEKAYREIKSNHFDLGFKCTAAHEIRVYDEADELENKVLKLNEFITVNELFNNLPEAEQFRLNQQLMAMQYYLTILVERINNF